MALPKKKTSKKELKNSKPAVLTGKETIYVDVDDEITHIIDKVKDSKAKIVALVLPKRASVLQSLVNMKLLKRSAVAAKKNLVLITTEASLMPLAGAAGIHVAKSLQSRPEIPSSPQDGSQDDDIEEIESPDDGAGVNKAMSVGALAAASSVRDDDEDDVIEFDNIKTDDIKPVPSRPGKKNKNKNKKLKVPNFDKFRVGIVVAGVAFVLLIIGWYLAAVVLPKAKVTIKTDTTTVVSSFDFTASTKQTEVDVDGNKIPAVAKQEKKADTEKGAATGQRDDGTKASGSVTLSIACSAVSGLPPTIPSGTAVSSGGNNYVTQSNATLNEASFSPCRFSKTVDVTAAENGEKYNLASGKNFTVAGFSSVNGVNGSEIDGGTSKIVKIVTQKDVDDAVERIKSRQGQTVKDELAADVSSDNLLPLKETFLSSSPVIQPTPAVNAEGNEVTVTFTTDYSMLGVKRDDLTQLIKKDVEGEIDFQKQSLIDDGIDSAVMRINNNTSPEQAFISFRTSVVAGPDLDEDAIKEAIRGKKRGEAEDYIESQVGVQEVTIEYSPFWVYSTPKAAKKITIVIEKPDNPQQSESSNNGNE